MERPSEVLHIGMEKRFLQKVIVGRFQCEEKGGIVKLYIEYKVF